MAYSSSIKRAQAIKHCELCQDNSIKWRCMDCNMCLCEKCKTSHLKIPVTSQHQIITIGTPLEEVQMKIVIDNIPCKNHPKKMTCLLCRSCDSLICGDCVSSTHKNHNFDSIDSALDEKLDSLRLSHDKIEANLKCCESKTSEVENIKSKYNANFEESLSNMKQKEQELINAIKNYSKQLQEKVENERSQVTKILSKIQQDVDNAKTILENQKDEIETILTSNQGSIIFKANLEIKDQNFDSLPNKIEQFIPESTTKIKELFGSLQKVPISTTHALPGLDLKIMKTFTTDLPKIDRVVTLDATSAWINCHNKGVIRKVNIQDNNMTTSQEVSLHVWDIAVTSKTELLLSMSEGPEVKLLKRSGEITSFLTVAPLMPLGIHMTKDNTLIVGVKKPGNTFTPTDKSQRAITVYGMDGKQKHIYQYDKDGQRLFTFPSRITTNNNGDILVVDTTSAKTGRVVVLDKEGNLRWLYKGHSKINSSRQFDPRAIVTTNIGHIIVSDLNSDALHVLSEDGDILLCKVMRGIGILWPFGLDTDNEERLWLGCYAIGEKKDAKLHIIKLTS